MISSLGEPHSDALSNPLNYRLFVSADGLDWENVTMVPGPGYAGGPPSPLNYQAGLSFATRTWTSRNSRTGSASLSKNHQTEARGLSFPRIPAPVPSVLQVAKRTIRKMSDAAHVEPGFVNMEGVEYRILGPLTAVKDGESLVLGGRRQRMVLAVLLASSDRVVSRDALIESVWAGEAPDAAKATLHSYVSHLRAVLGDSLARQGDGYRVESNAATLDALQFEQLIDQARDLASSDPGRALALLQNGLDLWFGEPYGDLSGEPALAAEVSRLEELRLTAVEYRIEAEPALGNHRRVIGELETLVRENPFRERMAEMQMLALYRSGRQADALRAYQKTRTLLAEELGINPSPTLQELEQQILEQDPTLDVEVDAPAESVPEAERADLEPVVGANVRGYELREQIGIGDYGVVYRAFQPSVGREAAIKFIRPEYVIALTSSDASKPRRRWSPSWSTPTS